MLDYYLLYKSCQDLGEKREKYLSTATSPEQLVCCINIFPDSSHRGNKLSRTVVLIKPQFWSFVLLLKESVDFTWHMPLKSCPPYNHHFAHVNRIL